MKNRLIAVLVFALGVTSLAAVSQQAKPANPAKPVANQPVSVETLEQQQIDKQAQTIINDINAAADQLALYKRIEKDQAQLQQLSQQYQQAEQKPAATATVVSPLDPKTTQAVLKAAQAAVTAAEKNQKK